MRVDLDITNETLAWAAYRASELGISRRRFLINVLENTRSREQIKDIPAYLLKTIEFGKQVSETQE